MKCTKEAYEQCPFNLNCYPGDIVKEDTDCAEFIASVMAQKEKKAEEENE